MTKDWADVKETICSQYLGGWSLKDIRTDLELKQGFKACTRVYRQKLAEWGVMRCHGAHRTQRDEVQLADLTTTFKSGSPSQEHVAEDLPESTESTRRSRTPTEEDRPRKRRRLDPDENEVSPSSTEACVHKPRRLHSFKPWIKALHDSIEDRLLREPVVELLSSHHFVDGTDGILHYAATRESSVLQHVIDTVQLHGIRVNIRSSTNATALDYAINANNHRGVSALLKECPLEDFGGWNCHLHLHRAIDAGADWDIVEDLLRAGADPDYVYEEISPLNRALKRLDKDQLLPVTDNTYSQILTLFYEGATWDVDDRTCAEGYYNFVQSLRRLDKIPQSFIKCLENFLECGANPTIAFPICYSTGNATLDSFAIFHAEEPELAKAIVESVDIPKYGLDIATLLITSKLTTCRPTSKGASRAELLKTLFRRGVHFLSGRNPLSQVIVEAPQEDKATLLQAILVSRPGYMSINQADIVLGNPALAVSDLEKPQRWKLMAVLLGESVAMRIKVHVDHAQFYKGDDAWEFFESVFTDLLQSSNLSRVRLLPGSLYALRECVAYAVTEGLVCTIDWAQSLRASLVQLSFITRVRDHYNLPPITIPNPVLLRLLECSGYATHPEHQAERHGDSDLSTAADRVTSVEQYPPEPWSELRSNTEIANRVSMTTSQKHQKAQAAEQLGLTQGLTDRYTSKLEERNESYRRYQAAQQRDSGAQAPVAGGDALLSMFSLWA